MAESPQDVPAEGDLCLLQRTQHMGDTWVQLRDVV